MRGIASKLFFEKTGIKISEESSHKKLHGPLIEALLDSFWLSPTELECAKRLLSRHQNADEKVVLFLSYVILAARQGHIAVKIDHKTVDPHPHQLWTESAFSEAQNHSVEAFEFLCPNLLQSIVEGAQRAPKALIADVSSGLTKSGHPLCRWNNYYYLDKHWRDESLFCYHLLRLVHAPPKLAVDIAIMTKEVESLRSESKLLPEQAQAIIHGCQAGLTVICGGPGTGKTYTAGELIRILWKGLSQQKESPKLVLAAPTGKAAANLTASLRRVAGSVKGLSETKALTLHALLGLNRRFQGGRHSEIHGADVIIVDECSMIDVHMMSALFSSVPTGCRLIMLGDPYQLPPVEAGGLFADMMTVNEKGCGLSNHVCTLKTCLRAESKDIVSFASSVNHGDEKAVKKLLDSKEHPMISSLKLGESNSKCQQQLVRLAQPHFDFSHLEDPKQVLDQMNCFRLLTPLRKGEWGVDALNQRILRSVVSQHDFNTPIAIPIIIVANDYRSELFNGDVGVLVRHSSPATAHAYSKVDRLFDIQDYALFSGPDGIIRPFAAMSLPKFEYAYSMSVHKSQGSEFDHVVVLLPNGSEMFGREVLYTAVTRAKKSVQLWSQGNSLQKILQQHSWRRSGVLNHLQALESSM